jgi:hypothetical protein
LKEATRFLIAFFFFRHLMCFPRSKFARLTAELADVRDLGKEAALYHFTFRFNPLHIGFCDDSSSSGGSSSSTGGGGLDSDKAKTQQENKGTSTNQEQKQEQHLPIRHAGRPADSLDSI